MNMPSWSSAFKAAIMTLIYSVGWIIIGGILIIFGFSLPGANYYYYGPSTGGIIIAIIGLLIIIFGSSASFYKVFTDLIADEVESRQSRLTERYRTLRE